MNERPENEVRLAADSLMEALATLPIQDLDSWRAERLRRKAQTTLTRSTRLMQKPRFVFLSKTYRYVLEPAFVASVSLAYLGWSIQTVLFLAGF